jgi:2-oxoglutarate ferredoxin oxidoreductase subunit gamma
MSLGNSQAANMVALGAIIKATGIISLEPIKSTMARMLSHKNSAEIIALNEQALDAGYNAV